jgi:DNA-binding LytR/AlgR family response regulator
MSDPKILIVEDEVLIAEHIKDYLLSFGMKEIYLAHNKKIALQAIDHLKPNLVLLDLHLEQPLDGIELAKAIDQSSKMSYIFITANADRLIIQEAVQTKAAAYITKPLKKSDLFAAIQIALKTTDATEEKYLLVKDSGSTMRIALNDILYIESNGNYIIIYTKKEKVISRHSLEWVQEHLPAHQFIRVHRSFIINIHAVAKTTSKTVFIGDIEIPVSRTNISKLTEYLKNY